VGYIQPQVTAKRILAVSIALLVAAVASGIAPSHPVWNPPVLKFLLAAFAFTGFMFAYEVVRGTRPLSQVPRNLDFVISFDERVISLAKPDGSSESALWADVLSISVEPHDDHFLIWSGPYFVSLNLRSGSLLIPAFSVGLDEFVGRLRDLPGVDRERLDDLFSKGATATCVLWARVNGESPTAVRTCSAGDR
jgi:hypothetical protein